MAIPVRYPAWKVELINAYVDDLVDDVQNLSFEDLFKLAESRDREAADQLRMGVFSMWALET